MQTSPSQPSKARTGHVTLVGAGPGDPDLLTLKAIKALRCADVILFDDLVSAEVLEFARADAHDSAAFRRRHRRQGDRTNHRSFG